MLTILLLLSFVAQCVAYLPGYNETYGYPDGIGGLIIEVPFAYKNGPPVWTNSTPWGAYGVIIAPGDLSNGKCEKVPKDSPFYKSSLKPVPLTNGAKNCMIGCNVTEVSETGVDPCNIGSLSNPTNSPMSCFDLGPGTVQGAGACGYNCTALVPNVFPLQPCHVSDLGKSCDIFCDSRGFPSSVLRVWGR